MKYKLKVLAVFIAMCCIAMNAIAQGNNVTSNKLGERVFEANCAACHDKGENTVEASKTLKSSALKENGFNGVADIKKRVEEGKNVMPIFKDKLKPGEIDAVAAYVWAQAQNNSWK